MENKKPFTEQEQKVMDLITEANNEYCKLDTIHDGLSDEWVTAIHLLQHVLIYRIVHREYPNTFR